MFRLVNYKKSNHMVLARAVPLGESGRVHSFVLVFGPKWTDCLGQRCEGSLARYNGLTGYGLSGRITSHLDVSEYAKRTHLRVNGR